MFEEANQNEYSYNNFNFDVENAPIDTYDVLPPNDYTAIITKVELKRTRAMTGQYVSIAFQIIDEGDFAGRNVWDNLCIVHPKDSVMMIAKKRLGELCRACNITKVLNDLNDLQDKVIIIKTKLKKNENNEDQVSIAQFKSINDQEPETEDSFI
jgi:hypothetical protein